MSDWNDGAQDWNGGTQDWSAEEQWQEQATEPQALGGRQYGVVKRWTEKGFGFIERDNGSGSVFCHARECPDRAALVPGSKVSFIFEADDRTGKATKVKIEEAATKQEEGPRETGTIKSWNADKGFGFIGRDSGEADAFVHKRDCEGVDFAKSQAVSFVVGEGPKGAAAKEVRAEDGGAVEEAAPEEEGERQLGKVKSYNQEKGFAFIAPCAGGDDLFSHKREFSGVDPYIGQPVSYIVEATEKGDSAKKVRHEDSVPEPVLSDEGREFGKVKNFLTDKGFGFINWKGEEAAIVFDKDTNGLTLEKDMCVSFKQEDGTKGPVAKDVRQEDPVRVARVTAKVHYGKVESYFDPTEARPTNGYGFIVPNDPPSYGAPKKYYFHMSELEDPDEDGGIEPHTSVSFIVMPARKGFQAVAVKIAEPPKEEDKADDDGQTGLESSVADMGFGETDDGFGSAPPAAADTSGDGGWGAFEGVTF